MKYGGGGLRQGCPRHRGLRGKDEPQQVRGCPVPRPWEPFLFGSEAATQLVGESFAPKVRRRCMPTRSDDSRSLQEFAASLGARDPKTVATYLTTVRDFVSWLALQPGGTPFHLGLLTETAGRGCFIRWSGKQEDC